MISDLPDIVFIGGTGVGKSTAAKFLENEIGYRRLAFAGVAEHPHVGSPRDVVTRIWGPEATNDREKLIGLANRARELDKDVWLHALDRELDAHHSDGRVVVDDCRFENELYGLTSRGFVVVRLEARIEDRVDRLKANGKYLDREYLDHEIEHYLDNVPVNYTIVNDGSIMELEDEVMHVLMRERRRR